MTVLTQHAPGTFCWPELLTTDQNAAKKFYTSQFGWKTNDIPLGPDAVYTIFQKNGKDLAALWKLSPDQTKKMGMPPNWNPYVAVTSADQSAAKAKQLGGTVLVEPMDVMDKGRMAAIKDPTGAAFSIWQAKSSIGASVLDETGALCWTELMTPDTAKAKSFYSDLIGWKSEVMPMPTGEYTVFKRTGGANAGGMMKMPDTMKGVPPHWLSYFQVEDAKATVASSEKGGARTLVPPTSIPNIGTFAVLADPQGAAFGILQPPR